MRDDRRVALRIGLLCFFAVSALGHHSWGTVDAIQRLAVTRALVTQGSVVTPEFGAVKYGPLQPVLMIPTYALGRAIGSITGDPDRVGYRVTAFFFDPLLVSWIAAAWYAWARRLGYGPRASSTGALTLVAATLILPYSRWLFSEPLTAAMLLGGASRLLTRPGEPVRRAGFFFLAGAVLNNVVFAPVLLVAALVVPLREARSGTRAAGVRSGAAAFVALVVTTAGWCVYNVARYGAWHRFGYGGETFSTPLLRGLHGLLASPGRGLVLYSFPTFVAAALLVRAAARRGSATRPRDLTLLALFLGYLVLYARWGAFEGGWCWGPRFLLPFVPLLHTALLPYLEPPRVKPWIVPVIGIGLLVNAWEYATDWREWERVTFADGTIDYMRSVFEWHWVPALHGFAGGATLVRLLQFAGVWALAFAVLVALRRRSAASASAVCAVASPLREPSSPRS